MRPGKAEVLLDGEELVIWAYGALVGQALYAARRLRERGASVGVVDARFAKPLDEELFTRHARQCRHILTVEEHQRAGGLGAAFLEAWSRIPDPRARIRILGVPDRFIDHMSSREEQLANVGIDADGIEKSCLGVLRATLV